MQPPTHLQRVLDLLDGVRSSQDGYQARCPAHDDATPSLSIRLGDDSRILLKCFAGCSFEKIRGALKLTTRDLRTADSGRSSSSPSRNASGATAKTYPSLEKAQRATCPRGWKIVHTWTYQNANGDDVLWVTRYEPIAPPSSGNKPKKTFRPFHCVDGGFAVGDPPMPLPLYRLPDLIARPHEMVYLVEGEKAADALAALGFLATTTAHGAKSASKSDLSVLAGREVVVLPDNDPSGEDYAKEVVRLLQSLTPPPKCRVLRLPDLPPKGDAVEFVANRREKQKGDAEIKSEIEELVAALPFESEPKVETASTATVPQKKPTFTELMVNAICARAELFHDPAMVPYISFEHHGAWNTWEVASSEVGLWIGGIAYHEFNRRISRYTIEAVQDHLKAIALYESEKSIEVFHRLALIDGHIYYALHDDLWQVVDISTDGWKVVSAAGLPVRFTRDRLTLAQVVPELGGDIDDIFRFVNVADDKDRILLKAFLVSPFIGDLPRPILELMGEAGSGKSVAARYIIFLLDPQKAPLRTIPHDERDMYAASQKRLTIALDNRSHLTQAQSDMLCMFSTGGSHPARKLFTDGDTHVLEVRASAIITTISSLLSRSDLASRTISLGFRLIDDGLRKDEAELLADWRMTRPKLVGALFSALVVGLRNQATIRLEKKSRLADFERFATACAPALKFEPEALSAALSATRQTAADDVLESSLLGRTLLALLDTGSWAAPCSDLLDRLNKMTKAEEREKDWPKSPRALRSALQRLAPSLRILGFDLDFSRAGDRVNRRIVSIWRKGTDRPQPSEGTADRPKAEGAVPGADAASGTSSDGSDGSDGPKPFFANESSHAQAAAQDQGPDQGSDSSTCKSPLRPSEPSDRPKTADPPGESANGSSDGLGRFGRSDRPTYVADDEGVL